ncbi:MAG TPA: hypothetical protein HA222_02550, partial [Candidatus Diapherotrites archaeon]|nr:hypothetical protein [Candidatus Diapherotrites archaeon]
KMLNRKVGAKREQIEYTARYNRMRDAGVESHQNAAREKALESIRRLRRNIAREKNPRIAAFNSARLKRLVRKFRQVHGEVPES